MQQGAQPVNELELGREISVVVPHYNDLARLQTCLDALSRQSIARERFEIVVADNRSPCGLAAVERVAAGRARVIDAPEKGAGPARNAGVAASTGRVLAFTDCDCVPEPGWIAGGLAALDRADLVGGRMVVSVGNEARMTGAEAFERVFAFDNRAYVEGKGFSVTANLFTRREVFDAVGPFCNGVSEDVEWCRRAVSKGYRLGYAAEAGVAHPARASWSELRRKWQRMNSERFQLEARGPAGKLRWAARSMTLPLSILAHAPKVAVSPALPNVRTRMAALVTLARIRLWRMANGLALLASGGTHR
jgi:GT2 family glycosyltransferase